ncbi:RNA polymerase sigma-70 factor [Mucilaginibacter sp. BJC16-A38]|uniref:RNA polymerase sigma factor n=1 Tax=Mucilaginibacter phenanthrenivorans TaxID=1234842 RepID=UPI002157B61E|nr:RNA polymerase sigma-70 factor [Mucilaginibacter phenanthrenivorans]MCR8561977.1 RNA polymerase sigma-70 factor [Mucilaginibacter phenanthrenivorans]
MADYNTLSDSELLQLLKESDHAAYTEIYQRYFHLLFVHAYKKLRDENQAKDIVQDIFASLWFKRESGIQGSNLGGYLYTAVRNRIFDLFAHDQVKSKYLDSLNEYMQTHSAIPTDYLVRENDLKKYIEKEIQALPPNMKLIFELSRKDNLTHKEIAEKLNTSENNVSKQLNNALRVLKTKLGIIIYLFFLIKL